MILRNNVQMMVLIFLSAITTVQAQDFNFRKGSLIYENKFAQQQEVTGWTMEGPGILEFRDNWMEMYSPGEKFHHVFWCPKDFPASFVAEWEVQNLNTEAGLCIIFFSAKGKDGKNIFDPSLPKRDGTFNQYTKSKFFDCYHISYYANGRDDPGRETAHLRKNSGFQMVQEKEPGIPLKSTAAHQLRLVKDEALIVMYVDDRKIIEWSDDGRKYGAVLQDGKIGFRQMKWTHFRYRNLKVWNLNKNRVPK